jgi:thiaminase
MAKFHQHLLNQNKDIWRKILSHPFLQKTAEQNIPDETFKTWIRQDYVFVGEAIPFIAVLLAKSPPRLRSNFIQILSGLEQELRLFRKNAEAHGVSLEDIEPFPTCHAYIQFLLNTGYNKSFEEGFIVLYAAEKVYYDSWMAVKQNLKGESKWQGFINNWASDAFGQYVDWLAETMDQLVAGKPETDLKKCAEIFTMTARYEYLFWDMAVRKENWPV